MKFLSTLFLITVSMVLFARNKPTKLTQKDVIKLHKTMQGFYSSQKQSKEDSSYFDIRLKMVPIWSEKKNEYWLYVEQAMSTTEDKPYRQRVYQLTLQGDTVIASNVYTIKDGEKYYGDWKKSKPLENVKLDDLELRKGCAIYLVKSKKKFSGSTNATDCESSLKGASYATSEVIIKKKMLESWDRGWDTTNKQVWGAVKGGYKFKLLSKTYEKI